MIPKFVTVTVYSAIIAYCQIGIFSSLHECKADMLVHRVPREAKESGAHVSVAAIALPSSSAAHASLGSAKCAGALTATTFIPTVDSTPRKFASVDTI